MVESPSPQPTGSPHVTNRTQEQDKVKIRRPTFSEIPLVCKCLTQAFKHDPMFGDFVHPYRDRYPDDVDRYWIKRFRNKYFRPNEVFLITTEKDSTRPRGEELITGVAHWTREGDPKELERLGWATKGWWDKRNILQVFAWVYATITSYIYPNRAASRENESAPGRSEPFIEHYWSGSRSSHWELHLLGVHPDHQNKGLGRALVAWGMDKAREEGVACSVVVAENKDRFYQRCGFEVCVGNSGEGEGNPCAGVAGGNIWFKDFQDEVKDVQT